MAIWLLFLYIHRKVGLWPTLLALETYKLVLSHLPSNLKTYSVLQAPEVRDNKTGRVHFGITKKLHLTEFAMLFEKLYICSLLPSIQQDFSAFIGCRDLLCKELLFSWSTGSYRQIHMGSYLKLRAIGKSSYLANFSKSILCW